MKIRILNYQKEGVTLIPRGQFFECRKSVDESYEVSNVLMNKTLASNSISLEILFHLQIKRKQGCFILPFSIVTDPLFSDNFQFKKQSTTNFVV